MTNTERIDLLRRTFDAVGSGNMAPFISLLAPDVTYRLIGSTALSGTMRGRDVVVERLLTPLGAALATPLRFQIQHFIADKDCIVMQARGHSTLKSGAPYNNTYCFVLRFHGVLLAEITEYLDTQLVTQAFGVPVEREALLRAMDYNMWDLFREDVRLARGGELLETPAYWMGHNPRGAQFHNMVMVKASLDADSVVAAADAFYGPRRKQFSICLRTHADGDLEAALRERGFQDYTSMPGMVLLGDPGTEAQAPDLKIRRVVDDQGRLDFMHVTAEAYATYDAPREYAEDAFAWIDSVHAPHLQGFLGYVEGQPVAAASLYLTHGAAGIGWVGTLPDRRKRGYAEAVTWAAVREGFRRGAGFANLQASPMGRAVYERMGFVTQTEYRVLAPPN